MHTYISREIGNVYSGSAGWNVATSNLLSGYDQVDVLERIANGRKETVFIGVSFGLKVPETMINALKQSTVKSSVFQAAKPKYEILVPKNTDTSAVPKEFQVRFMNAFGFEDEALVWYKKPVQTIPQKAA